MSSKEQRELDRGVALSLHAPQGNDDITVDGITIPGESRNRCETWSRVMGYMARTASANPGKQAEFAERVYYKYPEE